MKPGQHQRNMICYSTSQSLDNFIGCLFSVTLFQLADKCVIHNSATMSDLVQTKKSKAFCTGFNLLSPIFMLSYIIMDLPIFDLDDKRKPLGQFCTFNRNFFSYGQLVTSISTEIQESTSKESLSATIVY